ncbi:hypothetical protein K461DRAFT_293610 [Myriangium duriaei CBS 260.36]|uniref:DUF3835 domain-containing protein n=1 Tax=Myriangium duriaei CBS 260.36 TaxID=1168546 RepID=A0A9P4MHL8_9PEZI|nr:hypothetical protein K461DRAFT_293610 [Myriangium duriaei CBS 260.36]
MATDIVASVEARRAQLEASLTKLQTALQHWRTWDVEYEGLKEELGELDESAGSDEIIRIADDFGGELLTKKEIDEITGIDKRDVRKPQYIVRLIEKRQDYVQQNINTITKQITSLDHNLEGLDDTVKPADPKAEPPLPISEIIEELDDEDNVVSSKIQHPEEVTAKLVETLRQAGVTNLENGTPNEQPPKRPPSNTAEVSPAKGTITVAENDGPGESAVNGDISSPVAGTSPASDKRINASTPEEPHRPRSEAVPTSVRQSNPEGSRPLTESLINGTFRPGQRVIEIDDDDEILASGAILPQDESPEDAQLRREMLQYHLNEVGNVVAEIDLLEGDSDDDFTDELADMDDVSVNSDLSEDEDEHGRNLGSVITEDYRREMKDLEKKLNGRLMTNAGPNFPVDGQPGVSSTPEPIQQRLSDRTISKPKSAGSSANAPKSVRFAEELDISPAPERLQQAPTTAGQSDKNTLASTVLERDTATTAAPTKPGKVSRFKQARASSQSNDPQHTERAQEDRPILSNNVLERESQAPPNPPTEDEDDFDPELQRHQLAARYYELRNKVIRQEGGFKAPEEEEDDGEGPLMEEGADGRVRKVSRFKAARMKH